MSSLLEEQPISIQRTNFWILWSGQTISQLGSELTKFALPLLALYALQASAQDVGLIRAASTAPVLFVMLFAGVYVDRLRRKPVLIASNSLQATLLLILGIAAVTGHLSLVMVLAVTLVLGIIGVLFDVAYPAFIPEIVPQSNLPTANSRLFGAQTAAEAVGPGLAGLLVAGIGAGWVLILDAVSFFLSAISILAIRIIETAPHTNSGSNVFSDIKSGLSALLSHPLLRATVLAAGFYNLLDSAFTTAFLVYSTQELGYSAFTLGLLLGAASLGSILGATVSGQLVRLLGLGLTLIITLSIAVFAPWPMMLVRDGSLDGQIVIAASMFFNGLFVAVYSVQALSIRQAATPARMRGRILAGGWLFILGGMPVGALVGGIFGEYFGLRPTMVLSICAFPLTLAIAAFSPIRTLKELPQPSEEYWGRFK